MQAYRSHEHFGFSCTDVAPQPSRAAGPQHVQFWAKGSQDANPSKTSGILVHGLSMCPAACLLNKL